MTNNPPPTKSSHTIRETPHDSLNNVGLVTIAPWKKKLAMWATWLRIIMVPLVIALFYVDHHWAHTVSAYLFIIASVTDYFDGYWARKYGSVSRIGQLLDPIADKLLVSSVLIMLIPTQRIEAIAVVLLLGRDTIIGGIRSMAATENRIIASGWMGKWKTALQMVAIPALLFEDFLGFNVIPLGYYMLWGTVALSWLSAFEYAAGYLRSKTSD